jgi:hypothetical protein
MRTMVSFCSGVIHIPAKSKLAKEIKKAEITAKEPSDTMLKLRSAKRTLSNEIERFSKIEQRSRRLVKGKNSDAIKMLSQEIEEMEKQLIPHAEKQYEISKQKNLDLSERKDNSFLSLATLHADFLAAKTNVTDAQEQSLAKLEDLNQQNEELNTRLSKDLAFQKKELASEQLALGETIKEKETQQAELQEELKVFQNTKARIDSFDDPGAYVNDLSIELEENKLSLEAKNDVIDAVQSINSEVNKIIDNISEGIDDYKSIMTEFEKKLEQISQ